MQRKIARDLPLIGYSAGNFGKNLLLSGVDVTLLFVLTDLLDIKASSVSALMFVIFIGDLVFDIAAGYLAAWARIRGFDYRRLIAVGVIPCGVAFAFLYSLPALNIRSFGALAATLLIFRAAYAVIDVPHNSLLARVATDSRSRGRASGYRLFFSSIASLAIATVLTPTVVKAARLAQGEHLSTLGIAAAVFFCLALWIAAWSSGPASTRLPANMRPVIRLLPKPDRLATGMFVIAIVTGFAMPMFGRMMLYLTTYVLGRPDLASRFLLAVTLGQFPGVLMWINLVRLADKTILLIAAYAVSSLGLVLFALAGSDPTTLTAIAMFVGVGLSGVFMLPWGILADVIDFAEFKHGERRETAAFASMLVILKAGAAASVGTVGLVLARLGYSPGVVQPIEVKRGIEALAFGVPLVGAIAAILALSMLDIGHRRHAKLLRVLARRVGV